MIHEKQRKQDFQLKMQRVLTTKRSAKGQVGCAVRKIPLKCRASRHRFFSNDMLLAFLYILYLYVCMTVLV